MSENFPDRLARVAAERDAALAQLRRVDKRLDDLEGRQAELEAVTPDAEQAAIQAKLDAGLKLMSGGFREVPCGCLTRPAKDNTRCFHCRESFAKGTELDVHKMIHHPQNGG